MVGRCCSLGRTGLFRRMAFRRSRRIHPGCEGLWRCWRRSLLQLVTHGMRQDIEGYIPKNTTTLFPIPTNSSTDGQLSTGNTGSPLASGTNTISSIPLSLNASPNISTPTRSPFVNRILTTSSGFSSNHPRTVSRNCTSGPPSSSAQLVWQS